MGGERQRRGTDARGQALEKARLKEITTLHYLDVVLDRRYDEGFELRSITLKAPELDRSEWLAVVRVYDEGQALVGFHSGTNLVDVLSGIINRIDNRTMKWRPDEYA